MVRRETGDRQGEGAGLGNLGTAHLQVRQYEQAIEYLTQALPIYREVGDRRREGGCRCNLGGAYTSLGQHERAIEHLTQALAIDRELGLGSLVNAPWVGQSFLAERLGMTLTGRLRTPLDRPSHHARRRSPAFFFFPQPPEQVQG